MLTEAEHRACRKHRPESLNDGRFLRWEFPSHAGCRCPADNSSRGKHEIIKTRGLHPLISMRLERRGGHLAGKEIPPKNADGHLQALGLQLIAKDLDKAVPRWVKKDKEGGQGREICGIARVDSDKEVTGKVKENAPRQKRFAHLLRYKQHRLPAWLNFAGSTNYRRATTLPIS